MPRGATADRCRAEQFRGDPFRRLPDGRIGEQVFDFIEQATLEPGDLLLAPRPLRRHCPHRTQVLLRSRPGIVAGMTGFRSHAAEQDEDIDLDRIMCRLRSPLLQFALPESELIGQDADALHRSAERQRDDGMPCFVISGRALGRFAGNGFVTCQSLFLLLPNPSRRVVRYIGEVHFEHLQSPEGPSLSKPTALVGNHSFRHRVSYLPVHSHVALSTR